MCGKEIRRLEVIIEGQIIKQVTEFNYLVNKISENTNDMDYKSQACNRINRITKEMLVNKLIKTKQRKQVLMMEVR